VKRAWHSPLYVREIERIGVRAAHVVIVEGLVDDLERTDADLGERVASAWSEKYGKLVPDPTGNGIFRLVPKRARGWSENLKDGTVWTF
jgi:hypothetical protein